MVCYRDITIFSINLIIQWGYIPYGQNGNNIVFPISFNNVFTVVGEVLNFDNSQNIDIWSQSIGIRNLANNGFSAYILDTRYWLGYYYIAIGT